MATSLFDLTGRVALITGGSKGLGKAMARAFAQAGADVIISSRHPAELEAALPEILHGTHRKGCWIAADLSVREDMQRLADEALATFGRIDILVNNAGSNIPEPIEDLQDVNWDRLMELNLTSCMVLSRAVAPAMKERGWGRIIHISSVMGMTSKAGRTTYSATKAALIGMTRAMALDLGPSGVTVNCIAPGPFLTDLPLSVLSPADRQNFSDRTALGRWGDPQEVAGPALLLASDAGSYITGSTLLVDGGVLCKSL
ncbi:SDR family NAD(P)-dependent oxidoreductase [Planctellipticum variicoloris]|uniref:SDR family NAD(P)-dependent oxidoreductase n=1 Tax=Planctellipticum variicoloris TaxID=3064265 RepID=UPI00301378D6|nr:3-oxoacyl-ACP reductase FabG [Planctomycetaceae bacterium SH412]